MSDPSDLSGLDTLPRMRNVWTRIRLLRRSTMVGVILILLAVIAVAMHDSPQVEPPSLARQKTDRLAAIIEQAIATQGVEAASAQYRSLRASGFSGLQESESDTNKLGYKLLNKGANASAIAVFLLNAETHPQSANAYDSLAEAYLATGNKVLATENYQKVVAIDPKRKTAVYELQRLTHSKHRTYSPLLMLHIGAGLLGILSGTLAMCLRKGSRWHGLVGRVFVVAMMSMSSIAAFMAWVAPDGDPLNIMMGVFTFYLVATAWLTARRRQAGTNALDIVAMLMAVAVGIALIQLGLQGGSFAGPAVSFGTIALLAAAFDLRMIVRGGIVGTARITRHLWRMNAALFIAVTSFFLGQAQVFSYSVRHSGLLNIPTLLTIIALVFWLIRVRFMKEHQRKVTPHASALVTDTGPLALDRQNQ